MIRRICTEKAGHAGPHRWRTVTATTRRLRRRPLTLAEYFNPPCVQGLIDRREADVRGGRLLKAMGR